MGSKSRGRMAFQILHLVTIRMAVAILLFYLQMLLAGAYTDSSRCRIPPHMQKIREDVVLSSLLLTSSVVAVPAYAWGGVRGDRPPPRILHIPMEICMWRSSTWGVGRGLHGDLDGGAGWGAREDRGQELHGEELDRVVDGQLAGDLHGEELDGIVDEELTGDLHGEELDGITDEEFVRDLHGEGLDGAVDGLLTGDDLDGGVPSEARGAGWH
jgi:hypothetical protein